MLRKYNISMIIKWSGNKTAPYLKPCLATANYAITRNTSWKESDAALLIQPDGLTNTRTQSGYTLLTLIWTNWNFFCVLRHFYLLHCVSLSHPSSTWTSLTYRPLLHSDLFPSTLPASLSNLSLIWFPFSMKIKLFAKYRSPYKTKKTM